MGTPLPFKTSLGFGFMTIGYKILNRNVRYCVLCWYHLKVVKLTQIFINDRKGTTIHDPFSFSFNHSFGVEKRRFSSKRRLLEFLRFEIATRKLMLVSMIN